MKIIQSVLDWGYTPSSIIWLWIIQLLFQILLSFFWLSSRFDMLHPDMIYLTEQLLQVHWVPVKPQNQLLLALCSNKSLGPLKTGLQNSRYFQRLLSLYHRTILFCTTKFPQSSVLHSLCSQNHPSELPQTVKVAMKWMALVRQNTKILFQIEFLNLFCTLDFIHLNLLYVYSQRRQPWCFQSKLTFLFIFYCDVRQK